MAVAFFVIAVVLFPLGVGPELNILARVSAGVIWVAVLLSALLSLDRMFQADFEDGSLDQLALVPLPLELVVVVKATAHWIATCLPIIIAAPVLAILMNMGSEGFGVMLASLTIGSPALSFIGAIGAALTVAMRRGGVLVAILVLPLLFVVSRPQDFATLGPLADAWWVTLILATVGLGFAADVLASIGRALRRTAAALESGYDARTVVYVLADHRKDMGFLLQGSRRIQASRFRYAR